MTSSSISA